MGYSLLCGDCRIVMELCVGDQEVQTVVTSPPYFGLRDYGHDGQIGLEATSDAYVANLVEVFREVRRVLRDDGTLWLNLGDSYGRGSRTENPSDAKRGTGFHAVITKELGYGDPVLSQRLANKQLLGIPWRVAFALQADGWYLRQDIIWHKPNPMPESVTDRCTKAHEYLFLLSKSERYYFDYAAIKEPAVGGASGNKQRKQRPNQDVLQGGNQAGSISWVGGETRNRRSVWTINTQPFKGAHFATFPTALVEPCILAGSKPGDLVLDPFAGSGTTGAVALQHGRSFQGIDLNEDYVAMARARLDSTEVA